MTSPSTRRRLGVAGAAAAALVAPLAVALPAQASATRNEIVYTADDDNDGVYSIVLRDLETRSVRTVLPADPTAETLYDDPELSPDGAAIAFSTDRGASQFDEGIAVVNRDGSGFRRVTTPPPAAGTTYAIDVAPAWSPDGSRLLFTRITTDASDSANIRASTALYTVPAGGGASTPVPNATDGYLGDWSPDGSQIVFTALSGDADTGPITSSAPTARSGVRSPAPTGSCRPGRRTARPSPSPGSPRSTPTGPASRTSPRSRRSRSAAAR